MDRFGIGAIPCWSMDTRTRPQRSGRRCLRRRPPGRCLHGYHLRFRGRHDSVKIDINRGFFDMTKVAVIEIERCMASSAAITYDVMATANRISAAKRVPPFNVTTVRCGSRRSSVDLRGIELVVVPGLGTPTAAALDAT